MNETERCFLHVYADSFTFNSHWFSFSRSKTPKMVKVEDKSIVISNLIYKVARENDEQAFKELFNIFYGRLLQLAHMILRNNELAEDTVLEVFAKLWEKRQDLPKIESLSKYFYVLVKNKSLDQLRKNKDLIHVELTDTALRERVVSQHPEKIFLDKELLEKINHAILDLPEKCRMVYRLVKEEGHSYQDAAELLNVSRKTVDNHINLAMRRIRHCVAEYTNEAAESKSQSWRIIRTLLLLFIA